MGSRWIFLIDGPYVTISCEHVLIFDKNTCAWFAVAERKRDRDRDRERKRKGQREREGERQRQRQRDRETETKAEAEAEAETERDKIFYPRRKTLLTQTFAQLTRFLTTCKKPLRMTFH